MSDEFQVIFTSADKDKSSTANIWNIQTGTNLMTYKDGGTCALKGLSLLGSDYVIAAEKNKPLLKVWAVNSQLPLNSPRLLCPGIVTTVAVNPDKCHIAVAVQEKLHIYSVSSGQLLSTGAHHYQPIQVLKWSPNGDFVACGGDDCLITVWLLCSLVIKHGPHEPLYVFSEHSLPINDICITPNGLKSYLISVSSDKTCKIYNIRDGSLLLSVVFDTILTAVCTNQLQSDVFVGTINGGILQFSLHNPPRTKEYHLSTEEKAPVFVGHTKSITCLSNSLDGDLLLSGSVDETARIWHIFSKQCLRTIAHKGQITNAFFTVAPKQMFNHDLKLSVYFSSFNSSESEDKPPLINIFRNSDLQPITESTDNHYVDLFENNRNTENFDRTNSLESEVRKLKAANKQLYDFAVKSIFDLDKSSKHETNIRKSESETITGSTTDKNGMLLTDSDDVKKNYSKEDIPSTSENAEVKKVNFRIQRKSTRKRQKKSIFSI